MHTSRWAVIHTHPQQERWAVSNLERAGFTTYLPMYATRRRDRAKGNSSHLVRLPLFPRYAFVNLPDGEPWTPVRYSPGVARLLMEGGKPAHTPAGAVEAIQAGDEMRGTLQPPSALWRPGAPCKLLTGPFQGQDGVVAAVATPNARVCVIFLGALHEISVDLEAIGLRERE